MDTKRFNEEHAAKSRAVCERTGREDAERRSKLADLMDAQLKSELGRANGSATGWEKKAERRLKHIEECESALAKRNKRIKELEGQVEAFYAEFMNTNRMLRESDKLTERERQILDMWPRFEDGECVMLGEEVLVDDEDGPYIAELKKVGEFMGHACAYVAEKPNGNAYPFPIETLVLKRPAPKVLDADGVEKKISEKVWSGLYDVLAELRNDCEKVRHSDEATMSRLENDTVAFPAHYTQGGIECIDAMQAALTPEEFRGYLRGNILKYVWRFDRKGAPVEDLRKAAWYLDRLTREVERDA